MPGPVAVRSNALVCRRLSAGNARSNPAEGMNVHFLCLLCKALVMASAPERKLALRNHTWCVCVCGPAVEEHLSGSHKHTHTPGMVPQSELSLRRRGHYQRCTEQTQEMNVHAFSGIWMRIPSTQAPTDQRVRPHGHQDRFVISSVPPTSSVQYWPNPNYALQQKLFTSFYNQSFRICHVFLQ